MPSLSIKDVPEPLVAALRRRAVRNHRSLQGELMALVDAAASEETARELGDAASGAGAGAGGGAVWKTIEQIADEHRARRPRAAIAGPRGVALARARRDAR
jgi:plasmid stability protein